MKKVFEATDFYISTSHKNKSNTPTTYSADECIMWMAKFHNEMTNKEKNKPKLTIRFLGLTIFEYK